MAYDSHLEERIDQAIAAWGLAVRKKKMFGGLAYMLNGNMAFGIMNDELLMRASEVAGEKLLQQPGIRHFQMGSHTSKRGWYLAGGAALATDGKFMALLSDSRDYVLTLPEK